MRKQILKDSVCSLGIMLVLSACATMSHFDRQSYVETISIKVESLALIEKAHLPYEQFRDESEAILMDMAKIYEYEKHRRGNSETIQMWEIMLDPNQHLFAGFLNKWEGEDKLSPDFIREAAAIIESGFDLIIDLENNKVKPNQAQEQIFQFS